jgi:hypothetical protein
VDQSGPSSRCGSAWTGLFVCSGLPAWKMWIVLPAWDGEDHPAGLEKCGSAWTGLPRRPAWNSVYSSAGVHRL